MDSVSLSYGVEWEREDRRLIESFVSTEETTSRAVMVFELAMSRDPLRSLVRAHLPPHVQQKKRGW